MDRVYRYRWYYPSNLLLLVFVHAHHLPFDDVSVPRHLDVPHHVTVAVAPFQEGDGSHVLLSGVIGHVVDLILDPNLIVDRSHQL